MALDSRDIRNALATLDDLRSDYQVRHVDVRPLADLLERALDRAIAEESNGAARYGLAATEPRAMFESEAWRRLR